MKSRMRSLLFLPLLFAGLSSQAMISAPTIPKPLLYFTGTDKFQLAGKTFIKYHFDVCNKDKYPPELFAAAPDLPPCGANTKASRTWVDLFTADGKRLYGFCAISKPADLDQIYFALEQGVAPPSSIYIEMDDRLTHTKYKSNLAETSN